MLSFLTHLYMFAEVYTVVLVWVSVPVFFYAAFYFMSRHYGMFQPNVKETSHGQS